MYKIIYSDEMYVAHSKKDLIDLWSQLLFNKNGEHYKIIDVYNDEKVVVCGDMNSSHLKILEKLKEVKQCCENGACTIDFGGDSNEK